MNDDTNDCVINCITELESAVKTDSAPLDCMPWLRSTKTVSLIESQQLLLDTTVANGWSVFAMYFSTAFLKAALF